MSCPIWPSDSDHASAAHRIPIGESGAPRYATVITCPVCGEFEISGLADAALKNATEDFRWRLSWATRHASETGAPLVLHSSDLQRTTESVAEPRGPLAKADLLVLLLGSRADALGERSAFNQKTDWPLIYARGPNEAVRLLAELKRRGLVSLTMNPAEGVELTYQGWERLEALRSVQPPKSSKAFVAMWFDASMDAAYREGFYPALYALGYDPVRVDREDFLGKIDDYIVKSIRESAIVIADFTEHRHGVYWEAGFAHGLDLPVVYTCREDDIQNAHFDTRQYNHLLWQDPADLKKKLRERIEATITNRPKPRSSADA